MASQTPAPYKDVRSLARGLRIIETLSELGWAKIGTISAAADIDRSSIYRLAHTLEALGYVTRRNEDGAIALTPKFSYIADALKDGDFVTQFAWPPLFKLTKEVLWPCDFASLKAGKVLISLTTHKISPMSIHRGMIGKERYLLRSALGQAILAWMPDDEVERVLSLVDKIGGKNGEDVRDRAEVKRKLDQVRHQGYASSAGQTEAKISAIALPALAPDGNVAGAVNIVFFRTAMTTEEAAQRYLGELRECVEEIERSLKDFAERKDFLSE